MKNNQQLQQQLTEQQEQIALMRQLATSEGFFKYFFQQLSKYPTQVECFNAINDTYFDLFGDYRYSDYVSFRNSNMKTKKKKHR